MDLLSYSQSCYYAHMGLWLIEEGFATRFMSSLNAGLMSRSSDDEKISPVRAKSELGYDMDGTAAVIPIIGATSKGGDSFGGGSTTQARQAVRRAAKDDFVESIVLFIDSPGGHVAGTLELANDIRKAGEVKATHAHIQDHGTSAAYWFASQAHYITANAAAFIGNIGMRGAIIDSSAQADSQGIKVHLLSTGEYKAIGVPGVPVTDEQVAHMQHLVTQTFSLFSEAVQSARSLSDEDLAEALTGKMFTPIEALNMGIIDAIGDFQDVIHGEKGMTKKERDEIVAMMGLAVAQGLQQVGVVATAPAAQAEEDDEAETPEVEETAASTPKAKATRPYPKRDVPVVKAEPEEVDDDGDEGEDEGDTEETAASSSNVVTSSATYRKAEKKGAAKERKLVLDVLKVCALHDLTMDDAMEAIEAGLSGTELTAQLYEGRAADSEEAGEIANSTPQPQAKEKRESMTGAKLTAAEAFAKRRGSLITV